MTTSSCVLQPAIQSDDTLARSSAASEITARALQRTCIPRRGTNDLYTDKGEVGGSSPPRPTICFSRLGCCPTNLNPQSSPHFTAPFAYPLLTPSDIPPAPPVFRRSPPACTDRASSESLRDAGCPVRFSFRLSPCSRASWIGCDAGCEVRTFVRPRYALRPSLPPVANDQQQK